MPDRATVYCDGCETWVSVEENDSHVECACGKRFVVTITSLPPKPV